jgi:hypothetical protein
MTRVYGQPPLTQAEYDEVSSTQIRELMSYGSLANNSTIFDWWWDAPVAVGGTMNFTKSYHDLMKRAFTGTETWRTNHTLCMECYNFSNTQNNLRWVGNELANASIPMYHGLKNPGYNGDLDAQNGCTGKGGPNGITGSGPCAGGMPGTGPHNNWGDPYGEVYAPASCDDVFTQGPWSVGSRHVPNAHFWMWQPGYDDHLKSTAQLVESYLSSVGRGCVYLANIAPDNTGGISVLQQERYTSFGRAVTCLFGEADIFENETADGLALSPDAVWELPAPIGSDNISITLQEYLVDGQLLNFSRLEAFFPMNESASFVTEGEWRPALPADAAVPGGVPEPAGTLVSIGHKRIWMGVQGLRGATRLRLTALSAFNPTRVGAGPRARRLAVYDLAKREHCICKGV